MEGAVMEESAALSSTEAAIGRMTVDLQRLREQLGVHNSQQATEAVGVLKEHSACLDTIARLAFGPAFSCRSAHDRERLVGLVRQAFEIARKPSSGTLLPSESTPPPSPETEARVAFSNRERNTNTSARATVQVTLEIDAKGTWSKDTSIAQVDTQAIDSAESTLARLLSIAKEQRYGVRVVGKPSLVSVVLDTKEK